MSVPRLRKRQSSLAIVVQQERSKAAPSLDEEESINSEDSEKDERPVVVEEQRADTDVEGGDTDVAESSDEETLLAPPLSKAKSVQVKAKAKGKGAKKVQDEIPRPLRASSRLKSMVRRGKFKPELLRDVTVEFEFCAGDFLTVRGEGEDFYLCRVLEDVIASEHLTWFKVAWYNRVSDNLYEVSYDDECHVDAVITRVKIEETKAGKFSLPKQHIKQTKKLLREALAEERGEEPLEGEESEDDDDDDEVREDDEEQDEDDQPPAKRTRSGRPSTTTKPSPKKGRKKSSPSPRKRKPPAKPREKKVTEKKKKEKKEKPEKPRRPGVLIPNDSIQLYDKDPTFETREDISLMPCRWAIRAVLLNDMSMLKDAIENTKQVHTVHWPRSADVGWTASAYAIVNGNTEAIKLLLEDSRKPKKDRCRAPETSLHQMDTGTYNFYTFGHAVRSLTASRGSKEGNNAFLGLYRRAIGTAILKYVLIDVTVLTNTMYPQISDPIVCPDCTSDRDNVVDPLTDDLWEFCFQHNVSLETINFILDQLKHGAEDNQYVNDEEPIESIYVAVRAGNRKLAGYFVTKAIENDGFGFNFLHREVLVNDTEPLSKFRAASVTKKLYGNKNMSPLHCACINPNASYLQQLLAMVPGATYRKDDNGYQLIHYAAACEGPGPLTFLLSKGLDPDFGVTSNNITALMIAAQYGRDENVQVLLGGGQEEEDEDEAMESDENEHEPKANINIKTKSGQTALHFAAENGHESTVRLLAKHGMNVNALTAAGLGNLSPLMMAAKKGHLGVVKALVELGALADKRGKWKKTALMYAVKNGHSPVAAYLLRIGVDPNAADTSGNTPTHYAAAFGWLHCLQLLIKAGADPNSANTWKVTPLGVAMMKNNFPCAEYLLGLDVVDVNYTDDVGCTLLAQTISRSSLEGDMVEKIIFLVEKKGADVKRPDMKDWTPLHYLAYKSVYSQDRCELFQSYRTLPTLKKGMSDACCRIARVLLSKGADPNAVDKDGITPMMIAILQNNLPLIELLLENGAKVSAGADKQGKQVLHYIAERHTPTLDLREMYPDENIPALEGGQNERDKKLNIFFDKLVEKANSETMKLLVKGDGDINCQAANGLTPLMLALSKRKMEQVSLLLAHGADATVGVENTGRNVLHLLASFCTTVGTVKLLATTASKSDSESLRALVNAVDHNGFTPLLQACETYGSSSRLQVEQARNAKAFIKILVDQLGADTSALVGKKHHSKEAVIRSVETFGLRFKKDDSKVQNVLVDRDSMDSDSEKEEEEDEEEEMEEEEEKEEEEDSMQVDQDGELQDDEQKNSKEAPKSGGKEEEQRDEYDVTGKFSCLHFLCFNCETEDVEESSESCIQLLLSRLKHGHVINSRDLHGRSPLHIAVKWNNFGAVKQLISAGADLNLLSGQEDDAFSPPIVLAAMKTCKPDILVELLNAGADPNIPNGKFSASALAYAVTNTPDSNSTPLKITTALLNAGAKVDATDCNKRTALHYAVDTTTGGYEVVMEVEDLLIRHGADCGAVDIRGRIPLHYAFIKLGSFSLVLDVSASIVHELHEEGTTVADTSRTRDRHKTDRHTDYSLADPMSVVSLLCDAMAEQGLDVKKLINTQDKYGQTPFHRSALRGATICGLNLIQKGASFDIKDKDGNTPYGLAIRESHDGCAMMFSQMKAPPSTLIITPVTKKQEKQYEKKKKANIWKYKPSVSLVKPEPVVKSAFRTVVQNNWQGIAYLMLEAGLDFVEAIQAALEAGKFDLVWTLLRKQRHDANLQGVDSSQHNLLHLLAIHAKGSFITMKIAIHLLQRGVSAAALDSQGATPLHYAACNGNQELCELFLDNEPSALDIPDKDNVTPLAAVFSGANGNMTRTRVDLVKFLVEAGPRTLDICYCIAEWDETTTPLLEAVLIDDQKLVSYLIKSGASTNYARKDGVTPLMDAVILGQEDMIKVLLYGTDDLLKWNGPAKTDVNLAAQDKDGNSVVHHCVQTHTYGSSENVNMLQLLAKFKAPLNLKNNQGHTPLYLAKTQASGVMREALLELLSEAQIAQESEDPVEFDTGFTFKSSVDKYLAGPAPDVDADAAAMLEQARGEDEPEERKPVPVDSAFGMQGIGEVYVDPNTNVPYDILMTKVDVKWGMFGLNNFYKMQVVYQKGKNLWILFNRWGRIGDSGQHQRTPFSDPTEATAEFRKIFKSKSGNDWDNKDSFQKMPKKYRLVLPERNPERTRKPLKDVLKSFDLANCKPSRLPEEMQTFMKMLTNVATFRNAIRHSGLDVDQGYMPFGRLAQETIDKAREILHKIKNTLEGVNTRNLKETPDVEDKFSQIADLSNEFYMLIPVSNYRFERIQPMNHMRDVERHLDALHKLSELAFVSKVLLGAQYRSKEVSRLDYCFRALGCKLELMDPASDECQLLLQYAQNSGEDTNLTVEGIYRVTRPGEDERKAGVKRNHRLLWHGTMVSNMMGILKQGLRIAPPEAPTSGWSYGKGIYTSDSLQKSLAYCCLYQSGGHGFVLLCEVALGKQFERTEPEYMTTAPEGYNSTWAVTSEIPDPRDDLTTPYGAIVPRGRHVTNKPLVEKYKDEYLCSYSKNEYIVYDEAQVRLRYIVKVK